MHSFHVFVNKSIPLCIRRRSNSRVVAPFLAPSPARASTFMRLVGSIIRLATPNSPRPTANLPTTNCPLPTTNCQQHCQFWHPGCHRLSSCARGAHRKEPLQLQYQAACRLHVPWHHDTSKCCGYFSTLAPGEAGLRLLRLLDLTHKRLLASVPPGPPASWPQQRRCHR